VRSAGRSIGGTAALCEHIDAFSQESVTHINMFFDLAMFNTFY
jgi:hypothetical protein